MAGLHMREGQDTEEVPENISRIPGMRMAHQAAIRRKGKAGIEVGKRRVCRIERRVWRNQRDEWNWSDEGERIRQRVAP